MRILNQDLEIADVERMDSHYQKAASCFHQPPTKTPFQPNQSFMRVLSTDETGVFSAPWWIVDSSFRRLLTDFHGVDPKDIFRGKLAIQSKWSSKLDLWVEIVLIRPVYAWVGRAKHQMDKPKKLGYIGGGEQVFLPFLDAAPNFPPYIRMEDVTSSNFAFIRFCGWTEDLRIA
jgi:hypothetical protein